MTLPKMKRGFFMKKVILLITIVLLLTSLLACEEDIKENDIITDAGKSTKFSRKEVNEALDTVKNEFDFEGCTLKKVCYDEEKSEYATSAYLGSGKGSINKVEPENLIVVHSEFDVDSAGGDGSFEPNSTYTDWQFILIRDKKSSDWEIDTMGY